MGKKKNIFKRVLEDLSRESQSLFTEYLYTLENDNFGIEEKENFLVSKYEDIVKFYKKRKHEDKTT